MRTDYSDLVKIDQLSELVLRALRGRADQKRVLASVRDALEQMRGQIIFLRNEREKLLGMVANQPEIAAEKSKA
jgi:hypothetical protein